LDCPNGVLTGRATTTIGPVHEDVGGLEPRLIQGQIWVGLSEAGEIVLAITGFGGLSLLLGRDENVGVEVIHRQGPCVVWVGVGGVVQGGT